MSTDDDRGESEVRAGFQPQITQIAQKNEDEDKGEIRTQKSETRNQNAKRTTTAD